MSRLPRISMITAALVMAFGAHAQTASDYDQRFLSQYNKIKSASNGYFSPDGVPYHSIETLMVEAPDYGHETTSEAYGFWLWLEAQYGRITGDWAPLNAAWANMEKYMIPSSADQPSSGSSYNASKPATYAGEYALPSQYPSPLNSSAPVGQDPISAELFSTYGTRDIYGMHWLMDVDNWYGYGRCGDGTSKNVLINTFQRGAQESVWETVPHPSCETFKWGRNGGTQGFLSLFTGDSSYAKQWRYTNAPDADARVVQVMYWANLWATQQGKGAQVADMVKKSAKMGDYLRYAMFDKYFKRIGNCIGATACPGGTGATDANGMRDNQHYLMSWYYAWGGATDGAWGWRIGSSHNHFGYQNPLAAWALSTQDGFKPTSATGAGDWAKSLKRQMEFYRWLQSSDGAIAGGATNSWNGNHETPPAGTPTFYGMFYDEKPVYHDPASNTWFGFQAWSMQRVAEYYHVTGDAATKALLDKWVTWALANTKLTADGSYEIPSTLKWSGAPDTWNAATPGANSNLRVSVVDYTADVGVAAAYARTLTFYAAKSNNAAAKNMAGELLNRMWTKFQTSKGVATVEKRGDYARFDDAYNATTGDGVYVPSGWTGTNAQGATIDSNSTFISLRPKYKNDPDWPKVSAFLAGGAEPTFTYHRFWAQADVALAQADYGRLLAGGTTTTPSIVLSASSVTVPESGSANVSVTLSSAPTANVSVAVAKAAGGDADLNTATTSLTFTSANYNTPQTVTVTAAKDADSANGTASFAFSGTGLTGATLAATEQDSDVPVTLVASSTSVTVPESGTQSFTVRLAAAPMGNVTVSVARSAGDTDISVSGGSSLVFTPSNWNVAQTVTLAAAKDADTANGVATISVSATNAATLNVTATEQDSDTNGGGGTGGDCAVLIDTSNDWGSGQVPRIQLSNKSAAPISGWSVSFTESNAFTLSSSWSGTYSVSGRTVTITPAPWNGTIAANGSVEMGMVINYSGAKPVPTNVSWAGRTCAITVK